MLYLGAAVICFIMAVAVGAYAIFLAVLLLACLIRWGILLSRYLFRAIRDRRSRDRDRARPDMR